MRDLSDELRALRDRLAEAERYLDLEGLRKRLAEREAEASKPDLWDDPDLARRVTTELSRLKDDVDELEALDSRLSDAETLYELAVEDEPVVTQVIKGDHEKLGRNDPCWCGSGKKYKRCHGNGA